MSLHFSSAARCGFLCLAFFIQAAQAESPATADPAAVIVTANRVAQTVDAALTPVTLITRRDIERAQAGSVQDLLRGQVGVEIANNGGAGKDSSLHLRGTNANQVLVLVDGVKIGSATLGSIAWQDLPVELIDHIEIVRGPQSSLYGSEAIGGVIQIFTKKGEGPLRKSFALGAGSYGTGQASGALAGSFGGNGWFSVGASDFATGGFNACKGSSDWTKGCGVIEPDRDGYRNQSGQARIGWRFDNGNEVSAHWLHTAGDNDFDGPTNHARTAQEVLGVSAKLHPADFWGLSLQAGQSRDEEDDDYNGAATGRFYTRRKTLAWQNDFTLARGHTLTAGIDQQDDQVSSSTLYTVTSRNNTGLYAQYLADWDTQRFQLSTRRDDNQQFGSAHTGSIAWGMDLQPDVHFKTSYGTAFKVPSFNDLYWPGGGNPNLLPERSRSLNAGLNGKTGDMRWSLNAYETNITNLIGWQPIAPGSFIWLPSNINTAKIRGVETEASLQLDAWTLRGNFTWLDPRDESAGANNGNLLPHRARQALAFIMDHDLDAHWSAGATLRAAAARYEDPQNTIRMGGYSTVDARLEYRVNKNWRLQGRIENLLDKNYETSYLYNQAGRGVYLTLRYQD